MKVWTQFVVRWGRRGGEKHVGVGGGAGGGSEVGVWRFQILVRKVFGGRSGSLRPLCRRLALWGGRARGAVSSRLCAVNRRPGEARRDVGPLAPSAAAFREMPWMLPRLSSEENLEPFFFFLNNTWPIYIYLFYFFGRGDLKPSSRLKTAFISFLP